MQRLGSHRVCFREAKREKTNAGDSLSCKQRPKSNSQIKSKSCAKTHRSKSGIKKSIAKLKRQNQHLHSKLMTKKHKISQLKTTITHYQSQLQDYHHQIASIQQSLSPPRTTSTDHKKHNVDTNRQITFQQQHRTSQQLIQSSQQLAKQAIQQYRNLQAQFTSYKQKAQAQVNKFRLLFQRQAQQNRINYSHLQKDTEKTKAKHGGSTDRIYYNNNKHSYEQKSLEKSNQSQQMLQGTIKKLSKQNSELRIQIKNMKQDMARQEQHWISKERQLKTNLETIHQKVTKWENSQGAASRQIAAEAFQWQSKYDNILAEHNSLVQKYNRKRQKLKQNNQQWSQIFKDFLAQVQRLKKQINSLSQRNLHLIRICTRD